MHPSTQAALDSRMRAALARLTENEKICLRRVLRPQTAKEMALELGISPHAVEKRLKMARAKLGVSSSLHAARLLATVEAEYQQLGAPSSDLSEGAEADHHSRHPAQPRLRAKRYGRTATATLGVTMITTFVAAALALGVMSGSQGMAPAGAQDQAALAKMFQTLDRDRSGFIEASEYPRVVGVNGPSDWFAKRDTDGDGKVSQAELGAGAVIRQDSGAAPVIFVKRD